MITCRKCKTVFPTKITVNGKEINLQNRKYCLECSPYGGRNTLKLETSIHYVVDGKKFCVGCNQTKNVSEFYTLRGRVRKFCKECFNAHSIKRQNFLKNKCIEYKGGKCEMCGYSKSNWALEFHHKNPFEKDFSISKMKSRTFNEVLKKELDKCCLLCSNCHREEHERILKS